MRLVRMQVTGVFLPVNSSFAYRGSSTISSTNIETNLIVSGNSSGSTNSIGHDALTRFIHLRGRKEERFSPPARLRRNMANMDVDAMRSAHFLSWLTIHFFVLPPFLGNTSPINRSKFKKMMIDTQLSAILIRNIVPGPNLP